MTMNYKVFHKKPITVFGFIDNPKAKRKLNVIKDQLMQNGVYTVDFYDAYTNKGILHKNILPLTGDYKFLKHLEYEGYGLHISPETCQIVNSKILTNYAIDKKFKNIIPSFELYLKNANSPSSIKYPRVLKGDKGFGGKNVFLVNNAQEEKEIVDAAEDKNFLVQQFLDEEIGVDYRFFVAKTKNQGIKCVGAIKRDNSGKDFRSNVHQGAKVFDYTPTAEEIKLVEDIANYIGLNFGSVDMVQYKGKKYVIECSINLGATFELEDNYIRKMCDYFCNYYSNMWL